MLNGVFEDEDVIEVAHVARRAVTNQEIVNIQHWAASPTIAGPITTSHFTGLAAIRGAWFANMLPMFRPTYEYRYALSKVLLAAVQDLVPPPGINQHPAIKTYGHIAFDGTVGTGTNIALEDLPLFVSVSTFFRSSGFGKFWRSTTRFSPVPLVDSTPGNTNLLTPAALLAWNNAAFQATQPLAVAGNLTLRHVSYSASFHAWFLPPGSPAFDASRTTLVTQTNPYLRSQLSRKLPAVP